MAEAKEGGAIMQGDRGEPEMRAENESPTSSYICQLHPGQTTR